MLHLFSTERGMMGQINVTFNRCISNNKRYTDCINLAVGEKIFKPEKLSNREISLSGKRKNGNGVYEKYRDCSKCYDNGMTSVIIAIENQTEIHQAMVLRKMIYDAYEYDEQLMKIRSTHHQAKGLKDAEYIAGFSKTDSIIPVITICVYFGKSPWDAPLRLHDLMDFDNFPEDTRGIIKNLVNDYQIIVLDVCHMPEKLLDIMDSDLKHLFYMVRYSGDKKSMQSYIEENKDEMCNMEEDLYDAITSYTHTKELDKIKTRVQNNKGGINMCKAFDDLMKDERIAGRREGRAAGEKNGMKMGIKKGTERVNTLNQFLIRDGRQEDLLKSITNSVFQKRLFTEYQI